MAYGNLLKCIKVIFQSAFDVLAAAEKGFIFPD